MQMLQLYMGDCDYKVIHINHGLHGKHMSGAIYKEKMSALYAMRRTVCPDAQLIAVLTTCVCEKDSERRHAEWSLIVEERNRIIRSLAVEAGFSVNDLYECSIKIPYAFRNPDGIHYKPEGYELLSELVAEKILLQLNLEE